MLVVHGCIVPSAKSLFHSMSLPAAGAAPAVICPSGAALPPALVSVGGATAVVAAPLHAVPVTARAMDAMDEKVDVEVIGLLSSGRSRSTI